MSSARTTSKEKLQLRKAIQVIRTLENKIASLESSSREPIAIVGMSCRFPGGVNSPDQFWQMLHRGDNAITEVPPDWWSVDRHCDIDPEAANNPYIRYGGFLEQVDQFDARFFGISPREAVSMDPQQRLILEMSWEALERAGIVPETLFNSSTGVFIGLCTYDYLSLLEQAGQGENERYTATGKAPSIVAGRVAYTLGLTGPCMVVDTACSSALVSVHQACQSLRHQECSLALAGGVNLILHPHLTITLSKAQMLSSDGRCKTFDAAANGFVRGEGCGMVVLKRLSDAVTAGDEILGVIRGSTVNHDGRSSGLTVPNGPSQQMVIQQALAQARLEPDQVGYIEAHGTGTSLGDPIEMGALNAVFGNRTDPLWVGSVKTNMGHLEGAAGIAGLIKVVLSLRNGEIPPHLHFQHPNPYIEWETSPVKIPTTPIAWREDKRVAGVSSFGLSGTNAHVVISDFELYSVPRRFGYQSEGRKNLKSELAEGASLETACPLGRAWHILNLSAQSAKALQDLCKKYVDYFECRINGELGNICYTANIARTHFPYRLSLVAETATQMQQKLTEYLNGEDSASFCQGYSPAYQASPKVAFLFTGQGAQYVDMGRDLYESQPIFRQTIDRCDEILRPYLDQPLLSVLFPDESPGVIGDGIHQTGYTQPALFVLEYALTTLWQSWGVRPDILIGHSVGEIVAACVAGVFSLEDGLKLIAARGQLMQALPQNGTMVVVMATEAEIEAVIAPYQREVSIAAVNGPKNVVISGGIEAVQRIVAEFKERRIKTTQLTVSHAFHSPLMEPILAKFRQVVSNIVLSTPQIPIVSNRTGQVMSNQIATPEYWVQHIRETVRFADGVATLHEQGVEIFLEIGPKPTLVSLAQRDEEQGSSKTYLPTLRKGRSAWQQILESLGKLHVRGVEIDWAGFDKDAQRRKVTLPTYPFQRQRYWVDVPSQPVSESHSESQAKSPVVQWLDQGNTEQLSQQLLMTGEVNADEEKVVLKLLNLLVKQHREQTKTRSAIVSDYYNAAALMHSEAEQEQQEQYPAGHLINEPFLSFGIFPKIVPEFSWIQAMTRLQEHRQQTILMHQAQQELRTLLFAEVDFASCREVLDFGCGYGSDLMVLAQRYPHLSISGYTISTDQASIATEKVASYRLQEQVQVFNHDSTSVPFPHECDLIYGIEVACHIKNKAALFANIGEHLRQDGMLVLADFVSNDEFPIEYDKISSYLATQNEWVHLLSQHHLAVISCIDVSPEIANFFEVSDFEAHVAQLPQDKAYDITRAGIQSHENLRKLLRKGLVSYVLLTAQKQDDLSADELRRWNQNALNRAASYTESSPSQWLYQVQWQPSSQDDGSDITQGQPWLILADADGTGEAVADVLIAQGEQPILVFAGTDYEQVNANTFKIDPNSPSDYLRLLQAIPDVDGVVHMWSLNQSSVSTSHDLEAAYQYNNNSCASTLQLLHALLKSDTHPPSLWLVTQSAQAVVSGDRVEGLTHSTLWGMGKVIGVEHPELNCVLLDLDANAPVDVQAQAVYSEINSHTPSDEPSESQVAWRDGTRYVARLGRYDETAEVQNISVREDGTYLITGGLGGLGLLVAHWLVEQGAKHLVLMGRSQPKPEVQIQLDALRELGAEVTVAQADVANKEQVAKVIANIDDVQPLRGIIHAAGITGNETLLQQDWQRFDKVLKPKVWGTWNLHTLTLGCDLDFFVLFSSAATLLGGMRQASYTAANAFLDAFAHYRRAQGLPAMSIDWAFWGEVGMATQAFQQELSSITALGYTVISPERGMQIFERLLSQPVAQIGVIPINWAKFLDVWQIPTRFLEAFESLSPSDLHDDVGQRASFRQELEQVATDERSGLLRHHLRAAIIKVLGLRSSDEIDSRQVLMDLGFDSLMAIELRNNLAKSLAHQLPATLLFDYPTLNALADHLEQELFGFESTESEGAITIDDDSWHSRTPSNQAAHMTDLSEDEAISLLMDKLDQIGA